MHADPIVIVAAKRTPMGGLLGSLQSQAAWQLGANAIQAVIEQSKIDNHLIDEVYMGCVLQSGQGQAPARQAAIHANLPHSCGATTINKMCGSGMKSVMMACDQLLLGHSQCAIAGGMESMSNAPYLLNKARQGYRLGHNQVQDSMFLDGLEDAYDRGKLMGVFAENTASKYQFTRESQDEFALSSLQRAKDAIDNNCFQQEISPVNIEIRKQQSSIDTDEAPGNAKPEKIPKLRPAFAKDGTVTAANSSSISDGAAALLLMRRSRAEQLSLSPMATIVGYCSHAQQPEWFTTAPAKAIEKLLPQINWSIDQVDLFEINEAFAVVTMAAMQDLSISHDIVNIHGGACALGHPIGASGARIIVTLIHALKQQQAKRGIAALCIGGGEATALAIEVI